MAAISESLNTIEVDVGADTGLNDEVVLLREWGTDNIHPLPSAPIHHWNIGTGLKCGLRINGRSIGVAEVHAQLVREQARWQLRDLNSQSGVWLDGSRRLRITLEPGSEIGIGSVTLVAESSRSIALRSFVSRLLGWRSDKTESVDLALRAVRMAQTRRVALVMCGTGDLVPIAQSLHNRVLGADRPFILCDPRRSELKATVRCVENYKEPMLALLAADGGSLCIRAHRIPSLFSEVTSVLRDPRSRVQLVVCAESPEYCEPFLATPIYVPPLNTRGDELDRIIDEYAQDAFVVLGMKPSMLPPEDHEWVMRHASSSLSEIEKATLRVIMLRSSSNITSAAARLGMAGVSLARWLERRKVPAHLVSPGVRNSRRAGKQEDPDARAGERGRP